MSWSLPRRCKASSCPLGSHWGRSVRLLLPRSLPPLPSPPQPSFNGPKQPAGRNPFNLQPATSRTQPRRPALPLGLILPTQQNQIPNPQTKCEKNILRPRPKSLRIAIWNRSQNDLQNIFNFWFLCRVASDCMCWFWCEPTAELIKVEIGTDSAVFYIWSVNPKHASSFFSWHYVHTMT